VNESQKFENERKNLEISLGEAKKTIDELKQAEKKWEDKFSAHEAESKQRADEVEKLKSELEKLIKSLDDSKREKDESERSHNSNQLKFREKIFAEALTNGELVVKEALHLFEDPILYKCKSSADFLLAKLHTFPENLTELISSYKR